MGTLGGPAPISKNGQVVIPKHVMTALGLVGGRDAVVFRVSDDDPEVVVVVPMAVADRRMAVGERAARLARMMEAKPDGESASRQAD